MHSHTIEITGIPESLLKLLDERAREQGSDRNSYLRALIERDVLHATTLRDLFAPVREDIRAQGLTDADVETLLEQARQEVREERRAKRRA